MYKEETPNTKKRIPKGDVKFQIELTPEQQLAKDGVFEKDVTFILGSWGSGKTLVSANIALDLFFKRQIEQIIISRPIVANKVGLLPGGIESKLEAWINPIRYCFYDVYGSKQKIDTMFEEKQIEILPVDFAKGITFRKACVIMDEFEDLTCEEFAMILSRLGQGSKIIFTGSAEQVDKSVGKNSCIEKVLKLKDSGLVNFHTFSSNHRNELIYPILEYIGLTNIK